MASEALDRFHPDSNGSDVDQQTSPSTEPHVPDARVSSGGRRLLVVRAGPDGQGPKAGGFMWRGAHRIAPRRTHADRFADASADKRVNHAENPGGLILRGSGHGTTEQVQP